MYSERKSRIRGRMEVKRSGWLSSTKRGEYEESKGHNLRGRFCSKAFVFPRTQAGIKMGHFTKPPPYFKLLSHLAAQVLPQCSWA